MSDSGTTTATELIALIDRLERLLNESDLSELEVEAGETAIVLRKPGALVPVFANAPAPPAEAPSTPATAATAPAVPAEAPPLNAVVAPLTGIYYSSPSPGAQPYVSVGATITSGQVIGLIEAMKLFNEIKSDRAGRVTRIHAQEGALVKAKQPLIEVEP